LAFKLRIFLNTSNKPFIQSYFLISRYCVDFTPAVKHSRASIEDRDISWLKYSTSPPNFSSRL